MFFTKDKFVIGSNLLVALAVFNDAREPDLFLIPATAWLKPDGVLVDREYGEGRRSKPEYGINLSLKGIAAVVRYSLGATVDDVLIGEGARAASIPLPSSSAIEGVG